MDNNTNISNNEYVLKEELSKITLEIDKEISILKNEIEILKDKKVDTSSLQQIKSDIEILKEKINQMSNDRKEDREVIAELKTEIQKFSMIIQNTNLNNVEIKTNQANTFEKIKDLKEDISGVKKDVGDLNNDISSIKTSIENSFWHVFMRLYNSSKMVKLITYIIISITLITMFSAFMFYASNGIPWDKIKNVISFLK